MMINNNINIRKIIDNIDYHLRNNSEYKLIISTPLNTNIYTASNSFKCGNHLLYRCDVAYKIDNNNIETIKNRYEY